nr:hypothetical protein [Pseudomonas sp.]
MTSESINTYRGFPGSPLLVATMVVCNLWHLLGGPDLAFWGIALSAGLFLVAERRTIPRSIGTICIVLAVAGMIVWPFGNASLQSLERGVYIGAMISSVMVSVSLLARAALRSPALKTLTSYLLVQSYRRRYVLLAISGQILPCMLGFAGVHMLFSVAADSKDSDEGDRLALFTAISRSFSAATLWSPTFGNMVILLALYPQLAWSSVLPIGVGMAVATILLSMVVDHRRLKARPRPRVSQDDTVPDDVLRTAAGVMVAMLVFFGVSLGLAEWLELPISASISMLAPAVALGLHFVLGGRERTVAGAWRGFRADAAMLRSFAPEIMLFLVAGCGGTVIAESIPHEWIAAAASAVSGHPTLAVLFLMLSIITLSCIGIHPVLSVVLLSTIFTPEALQLPLLPHFAALLTGWGIASTLAPFSMLSMTASRYAGISALRISSGCNWLFGSIAVVLATAVLTVLAY